MIVAVGNERLWQRFCEVLGITETLMRDPRFATNAQRNANRQILVSLLEEILMRRDAAEWIDALVAVGIPCGPINFPDDTLEDPHTAARDMIVELEHPAIGTIRSIGFPVQFSATGPSYRRYPPRLGEHNEEILREIGTETLPSGT
jgi:formyl-CoA transferase